VSDVTAGVDDGVEWLRIGKVDLRLVHVVRLLQKVDPSGKYSVYNGTVNV